MNQMESVVVKIEKSGNRFNAWDINGNKFTSEIGTGTRKKAYTNDNALEKRYYKDGRPYWKLVPMEMFDNPMLSNSTTREVTINESMVETPTDHEAVLNFIHTEAPNLQPKDLVMKPLKWKFLCRSAVRGKNIMMTGFSGCGKTLAAKSLVKALNRPDFYFNLGATQDPRATLIGNTHYDSTKGTYFSESTFVKAISTPNAVILLDELSRAHPDAWNILMTVLDSGQRYLRLDEHENSPTIKVAEGVCFVATANIGNQFTSTRVMDRALLDRFTLIEMDLLTDVEETNLLQMMFPSVEKDALKSVAEISHSTRVEMSAESPRLSNMISTRMSVEIAGLLSDGFGLDEASEIAVYPFFDADGGLDSERTYIKQLVQKYLGDSDEELFTEQDMDESDNN
jgi:nitric oxide reductase NorQ protein